MNLSDIYCYYAKFTSDRMRVFNKTISETDYLAFKERVENLPEPILDIKHYVFGLNEQNVKKQIDSFGDYYLFVDYGAIQVDKDERQVHTDTFLLAVTVAKPFNEDSSDYADEILMGDKSLEYLRQIQKQMEKDQQCSPFLKYIEFPAEATPFIAKDLANSIGWTLSFQTKFIP